MLPPRPPVHHSLPQWLCLSGRVNEAQRLYEERANGRISAFHHIARVLRQEGRLEELGQFIATT